MIVDLKNKLPEELENLSAADFVMVQEGEQIMDEKFQTKPIGFFKDAMIRLAHSKVSMFSVAVIAIIIVLALIVPNITGYSYTEQNIALKNLPPKIPVLCDMGIADGSRILEKRKVESLTDTSRYPEGSIIELVNEYELKGVPMCDVKVDGSGTVDTVAELICKEF